MVINHDRHMGIFTCTGWEVSLIGAGGIGSPTALALAKMGIEHIYVYDDDRVDEVNVSVQMYGNSDIGYFKTIALENLVERYAGRGIVEASLDRITREDRFTTPIIISAVDTLSARKDIWEAAKKSRDCYFYLDARMGAEDFQLFTVDMKKDNRVHEYDRLVRSFGDDDLQEAPCTSKSTIYCAFISAGIIGKTVKEIVTGREPAPILVYSIPSNQLFTV